MGKMDLSEFVRAPVAAAPSEPKLQPSTELTPLNGEVLPSAESTALDTVRIPTALRGHNLSEIQTRSQLLQALTNNIPMNDLGMPKIIYRADLLDQNTFKVDQQDKYRDMEDALANSTILLTYDEGYPALPDGNPLWSKFQFESQLAYDALLKYLDMAGARKLSLLGQVSVEATRDWFHTYFWALRAKAYDSFNVAHAERLREQRILSTSDKSFLQAQRLIDKLTEMENEVDWESLKGDPEKWVGVLEKLIKIQRTAIGLSAHGNGQSEQESKVQSLEVIMRRIATRDGVVKDDKLQSLDTSNILLNPTMITQAQEMILRVSGGFDK